MIVSEGSVGWSVTQLPESGDVHADGDTGPATVVQVEPSSHARENGPLPESDGSWNVNPGKPGIVLDDVNTTCPVVVSAM